MNWTSICTCTSQGIEKLHFLHQYDQSLQSWVAPPCPLEQSVLDICISLFALLTAPSLWI